MQPVAAKRHPGGRRRLHLGVPCTANPKVLVQKPLLCAGEKQKPLLVREPHEQGVTTTCG